MAVVVSVTVAVVVAVIVVGNAGFDCFGTYQNGSGEAGIGHEPYSFGAYCLQV